MIAGAAERRVAALMALVAVSLAVMSGVHLSGALGAGSGPYHLNRAGIAEAVICVVLAAGAAGLLRGGSRARAVARAATLFAVAGFGVGLSMTVRGGHVVDVAYHATVLPLLLALAVLPMSSRRRRGPAG